MDFLNKLGRGAGNGPSRSVSQVAAGVGGRSVPAAGSAGSPGGKSRTAEPHESTRVSNGLKELLWNLDGLGRGALLDLGPAWQTTLGFFIERGFRVSSEDILRAWKDFLAKEEASLHVSGSTEDPIDRTPDGRATRFLASNLEYGPSSFDAVLLWDLLDYLEPSMAKLTVARVTELLRQGGVVFALFHSKKPEGFQRYRIADSNTLQVVTAPLLCPAQRVYQNREIQDLFGRFRTMKSFVGRDQLRETLFIK